MGRVKGWFTAAAALAFASVVMGAVVCATESGAACPQWPGCYPGQFLPTVGPGLGGNPLVEFAHRVVAGVTGPVVLFAALAGRRLPARAPRRLAWVALAGTLLAGLFGMLIVLVGIPWWLGVLDLASALVALVATLAARVLLDRPAWTPTGTAGTAWAAVSVLAGMHLLGLAVAGEQSFTRCLGWPLGISEADRWPVLQGLRLGLAVVVAVLVVRLATRGFRVPAVLLAAEVGLGLVLLAGSPPVVLSAAYAVVAVGLFGALALVACRVSTAPLVTAPEPQPA